MELFKMRLNMMVVVSSVLGYFIGMQTFDLLTLLALALGGISGNGCLQWNESDH